MRYSQITWLRVLRERVDLTKKQVSELTGISVNRLSKMERMDSPIRPHEAVALSQVLKVNPSKFVKLPKDKRTPFSEKHIVGTNQ